MLSKRFKKKESIEILRNYQGCKTFYSAMYTKRIVKKIILFLILEDWYTQNQMVLISSDQKDWKRGSTLLFL